MTTSHTPGQWRVSTDMRGLGNVPVAGVETLEGFSIANCGTHGEANARLIAAAPDLLAALQAISANTDNDCLYQGTAEMMRDMAREAIAKIAA